MPSEIFIQFERQSVAYLFATLLGSRGVPTQVLGTLDECPENALLITEPRFFSRLPRSTQALCLLVGAREEVRKLSTLYLDTPLTEGKIERALRAFLHGSSHE